MPSRTSSGCSRGSRVEPKVQRPKTFRPRRSGMRRGYMPKPREKVKRRMTKNAALSIN